MFDNKLFIKEVEKRPALYDGQCKGHNKKEAKLKMWCDIGAIVFKDWNSLSSSSKDVRVGELMKRWKYIRDNLVKYQRVRTKGGKAAKRKPCPYYDQLQFLIDHIRQPTNGETSEVATRERSQRFSSTKMAPDFIYSLNDEEEDIEIDVCNPEVILEVGVAKEEPSASTAEVIIHRSNENQTGVRTSNPNNVLISEQSSTHLQNNFSYSADVSLQQQDQQTDVFGHKSFLMSFVPLLNALPLHLGMQAREEISKVMRQIFANSAECANNNQDNRSLVISEGYTMM